MRIAQSDKDALWLRLMALGAKLGCHQRPERSFVYKGYQFPVCARCTGILISIPFAYVAFFTHKNIPLWLCLFGGVFMSIDGLVQYIGVKVSTNRRRFITGLCGGFGITFMRLRFYKWCFI